MNKLRSFLKKPKNLKSIIGGGIALVLIILLMTSLVILIVKTDGILDETTKQYNKEIARQCSITVAERLESDKETLLAVAELLKDEYETLAPKMNDFLSDSNGFNAIKAYDINGKCISDITLCSVANEPFFILPKEYNKTTVVDVFSPDRSNVCLIISTPIISDDNTMLGVIAGEYSVERLSTILGRPIHNYGSTPTVDSNKSYAYICRANGDIVTATNHKSANTEISNIFNVLATAKKYDITANDRMKQNMQQGVGDQVSYFIDYYKTMTYIPMGISIWHDIGDKIGNPNGWYLMMVSEQTIISESSDLVIKNSILLIITLIMIALVVIVYVVITNRIHSKNLLKAQQMLQSLYDNVPCGLFWHENDKVFTVSSANNGFYDIIGYTKDSFLNQHNNRYADLIYPDDLDKVHKEFSNPSNDNSSLNLEYRIVTADGKIRWVSEHSSVIEGDSNKTNANCTIIDITDIKETQLNLSASQQRYDIIMNDVQDIIFEWNIQDNNIMLSKYYEKKFGFQPPTDRFPYCIIEGDILPVEDKEVFLDFYSKIKQGAKNAICEVRLKRSDGVYLWSQIRVTSVFNSDGTPYKAVGMIRDITEHKRMTMKIEEKAKRDLFTGLYNRSTAEELIDDYLTNADAHSIAAMMILDVDNFKSINDKYGHAVGDTALQQIAAAIRPLFRKGDILARIGGDEFLIMMVDISEGYSVEKRAQDILNALGTIRLDGVEGNPISCSIGISMYPAHANTFETLYYKADKAMYSAKKNGKHTMAMYDEELDY